MLKLSPKMAAECLNSQLHWLHFGGVAAPRLCLWLCQVLLDSREMLVRQRRTYLSAWFGWLGCWFSVEAIVLLFGYLCLRCVACSYSQPKPVRHDEMYRVFRSSRLTCCNLQPAQSQKCRSLLCWAVISTQDQTKKRMKLTTRIPTGEHQQKRHLAQSAAYVDLPSTIEKPLTLAKQLLLRQKLQHVCTSCVMHKLSCAGSREWGRVGAYSTSQTPSAKP